MFAFCSFHLCMNCLHMACCPVCAVQQMSCPPGQCHQGPHPLAREGDTVGHTVPPCGWGGSVRPTRRLLTVQSHTGSDLCGGQRMK